ncbi:MAG: hypothetical protein RXQ80_04010 [Sulfolobaceae archaeon]|jgi:hypothetical protein|nr:hypothetical protein [Sulfolobaceae archaeon]
MLKYVEYTRHSLCEPLLTVNVYKKVEDGKVIALLKVMIYKNMGIAVYETDKLDGGDLIEVVPYNMESIINVVKKFYDPKSDDITVLGEKNLVDEFIEKFT